MDAWFDGAKMALSLPPTPPCYYLQPADELCLFSSFFLSLSLFLISQMAAALSLILRRTLFTRNKCILLFTDLVIYALCGFSHSLWLICPCWCVFLWLYQHMHLCVCLCSLPSVWAVKRLSLALFHIVILCSSCNILLFRKTQLSIISIVAGKLQSAFDLLLIFFLLVTLKWIEIQRSRNYRTTCVPACVCLRQSV